MGGLFGGGGGGGGGGREDRVSRTEPWGESVPFLKAGLNEAETAFIGDFYQGKLNPPGKSGLTQEGQRGIIDRARASRLPQDAEQELSRTLGGDYLYGGKGFNRALDAASNEIMPRVDTTFERAGRGGAALGQVAKTSALGDAFAKMYGQERNRQMQGLGMAPAINELGYTPYDRIGTIGTSDEAREREQKNLHRQVVSDYIRAISGIPTGQQSTAVGQGAIGGGRGAFMGGLGGALGGFAQTGSPYGALIGGGVGLLSRL